MLSFLQQLFLPLWISFYLSGVACAGLLQDRSAPDLSLANVQTMGVMDKLLSQDSKSRILATIMDNMDDLQEGETISFRQLAVGDFDDFNAMFEGAIINLPPTTVQQQLLFKLTLDLKEIYCTNINVSDILLTYNMESSQRFTFQVDVVDLAMDCFIEYDWNYIVSGKGNAQAYSDNNHASIIFVFGSTDFDEAPPTSSSVERCEADINLEEMKLGGDWASQILDAFEGLLRSTVETQVQTVACDELSSLGNDFVTDALVMASDALTPYLGTLLAVDPLAAENELELPEGVELLDFQDEDNLMASLFDTALQEIDALLGTVVDDEDSPNGTGRDLGVNVFLRSFLLDKERAFTLDVDDLPLENKGVLYEGHDMLTETTVTLERVKVFGLDTFTEFEPLVKIGNYTFQNKMAWEYLTVELDVKIEMKPSSKDDAIIEGAADVTIVEDVKISLGVDQLEAVISLLLAINQDTLGSLSIGRLLDISNLPSCLLSIIHAAQLTELSVSVANIREPTLDGFVSPGIDRIITRGAEALFEMYEKVLIDAAPNAFATTVKDLINDELLSKFTSPGADDEGCPVLETKGGFVNFHDLFLEPEDAAKSGGTGLAPYGDLLPTLMKLLREQFLAPGEDGLPIVNSKVIRQFTEDGSMEFGDLFDTGTRVEVGGLDAHVDLKAYNAKIVNIDTVGEPLNILDPVLNEAHLLNNTVSFGVGPKPLRLAFTFLISLEGDDMQIHNEVDISLDLSTATVAIATLLKIAEDRFISFPVEDMANLNCWLATMPAPALDAQGLRLDGVEPSLSLQEISAAVASMNLNVTCISCSSPALQEMTSLLSTDEGADGFTDAANDILGYTLDFLDGKFLQTTLDRLLNEAPKSCPHRAEYQVEPTKTVYEPLEAVDNSSGSAEFLITLMVVVGCLVIGVVVISFVVRRIVRRRNRKWLHSLPGYAISLMLTDQNLKKAKDAEVNRMTTSMFTSSDIPLFVRLFMPIVILGNIALFLSGHLSDGATVNIVAEFGGEGFTVDKFFEFSMARSTIDIWNAGGKELAILIGLFSGVWPYTKQLITLAFWFLPPRMVSVQRRSSTFLWLDTLGKWSMVDIFVLVISIAAFQVNIESPDVAFLPEGFYSVSLYVIPLWGLYANMIAQLVSQVSSHVIIHYQRRIADNASAACEQILNGPAETTVTVRSDASYSSDGSSRRTSSTSDTSESESVTSRSVLRKHAFERPHRGELDKVKVRRHVSPTIVFVALAVTGLLIAGCIIPSLAIEVLGVLGVAVESGQEFNPAVTEFNVFSLVKLLFDEARFLDTPGDYIGLGTLGILFVMTILVVPVLQAATLLRQWFANLTEKQRTRMSVLTEILQAWQYVEVYLLALIVSAWQLGPISAFMINSYCDGLDNTFATLVYYGILDPVDAQCFKVQATIESGTFILIAASVLLFLLHTFVVKAMHQYERDLTLVRPKEDARLADAHGGMTREEYNEAIEELEPTPVLFTDTFRWSMRREDSVTSSRRSFSNRSEAGSEVEMGDESFSQEPEPKSMRNNSLFLSSVQETEVDEGLPVDLEDRGA